MFIIVAFLLFQPLARKINLINKRLTIGRPLDFYYLPADSLCKKKRSLLAAIYAAASRGRMFYLPDKDYN